MAHSLSGHGFESEQYTALFSHHIASSFSYIAKIDDHWRLSVHTIGREGGREGGSSDLLPLEGWTPLLGIIIIRIHLISYIIIAYHILVSLKSHFISVEQNNVIVVNSLLLWINNSVLSFKISNCKNHFF